MRVALVVTVKNEEDILRSNLLYHRHIGVEEIFVFADAPTDGTIDSVADLPGFHVADSVAPESLPDRVVSRPEMDYILKEVHRHPGARQMLNSCAAAESARDRGCDWLISLDADELVCPCLDRVKEGELKTYFTAVDDEVEAVLFRPLEVLPRRLEYQNVLREERLFKNIFVLRDGQFLEDRVIGQQIRDPIEDRIEVRKRYLGHTIGKTALRLTVDSIPATTHGFRGRGMRPLLQRHEGWLLHYNTYSFSDFIKKYRNKKDRPDHYVVGGLTGRVPQLLFRDMVNSGQFSRDYLRDYFERWVLFSQEKVEALRTKDPDSVVEVRSVGAVLRQLESRAPTETRATPCPPDTSSRGGSRRRARDST